MKFIILLAVASFASATVPQKKHVYAFGTKVPLTGPVKTVTALPTLATAVPTTSLPILRSSGSMAPTLSPPVITSSTIIPLAVTSTLPPTKQVPVALPTNFPTTSSPFIPPLPAAVPEAPLPVLPTNDPFVPPMSPPAIPSNAWTNTATPLSAAAVPVDTVDEVAPTTTLPLTSQDVQAVRVADGAPVPIPSTSVLQPGTHRGIFQNVNAKFRDRINNLIQDIVDSVIEETKNSVHSQITNLG